MAKQEQMREDREEKSPALEEAFAEIEEIIGHLGQEEITLEDAFLEYQQGMKLLKHCNDTIDRVEKKVLKINEEGGTDEF